jgi:hypothetical protein
VQNVCDLLLDIARFLKQSDIFSQVEFRSEPQILLMARSLLLRSGGAARYLDCNAFLLSPLEVIFPFVHGSLAGDSLLVDLETPKF